MKIIVVVGLLLSSLCSFAQRVNEHGLKMVSEIEYLDSRGWIYLLKFKYDESNKLSQMTVYHKCNYKEGRLDELKKRYTPSEYKEHIAAFPIEYKLYRDFIKDDNGLTVKNYDTDDSSLRWEVAFDTYGNISRINVYEEFEPNAIKKVEFNLFYERDGIGNTFRLSRYSHTETSKRKGQTSWYGTTCGTTYREIFYYDGFLLIDGVYPKYYEKYKERIDYEHINDTNMNLPYFMGNSGLYGGGMNMDFFTLPEWLNCRSKYFMKYDSEITKYKYMYDDRDNLYKIEEWEHWNNKDYLKEEVKIKYLY